MPPLEIEQWQHFVVWSLNQGLEAILDTILEVFLRPFWGYSGGFWRILGQLGAQLWSQMPFGTWLGLYRRIKAEEGGGQLEGWTGGQNEAQNDAKIGLNMTILTMFWGLVSWTVARSVSKQCSKTGTHFSDRFWQFGDFLKLVKSGKFQNLQIEIHWNWDWATLEIVWRWWYFDCAQVAVSFIWHYSVILRGRIGRFERLCNVWLFAVWWNN